MDEWFSEPEPNLIKSTAGFSVKVLGRTGLCYTEGERSVWVDSEVLAKPGAMALFKDSITTWQGEGAGPVSAADRDRIASNMRRAFEFCGYELQVQEPFDRTSVALRRKSEDDVSSLDLDITEPGRPELEEVAAGVYAYVQPDGSWFINNTGFIAGSRSVVSIDACSTRRRTQAYLDRIATVTKAPVTTLVNTHHHGDHTHGNCVFGDVTIIGHERCRDEVIRFGLRGNTGLWEPVDWGELTLAPPTVTFADRLVIWADDVPIHISHVGQPAHTSNDSLVWLPEQRVLFCGDLLFNGGTPFVLMGSVTGSISVLTDVLTPIPARVIVPGHGSVCGPELIETVAGYLRFVLDTARRGQDAGLSPLQVARDTDLGEYSDWLDRERIVGNLHRAYCDLDPRRPEPDVAAALMDMVAYNGGRPLSCHA